MQDITCTVLFEISQRIHNHVFITKYCNVFFTNIQKQLLKMINLT